jgi:hypothetical protein
MRWYLVGTSAADAPHAGPLCDRIALLFAAVHESASGKTGGSLWLCDMSGVSGKPDSLPTRLGGPLLTRSGPVAKSAAGQYLSEGYI